MSAESMRVVWEGRDTPKETFLAIIRSPVGALPFLVPASNGIQMDGTLKFTDWSGEIVVAQPGDTLVLTTAGIALEVQP